MSWKFVFCVKKWSRNQCSIVNAHNYKSVQKLSSMCHERRTSNPFFLKLAFRNLDLWTPYLNVKLNFWDNFWNQIFLMAHRVIKKLKPFWNQRFLTAHRVIKKLKPFLKSKIFYGARSNQKIEAFFEIKEFL